jgi:hypothetical protein
MGRVRDAARTLPFRYFLNARINVPMKGPIRIQRQMIMLLCLLPPAFAPKS